MSENTPAESMGTRPMLKPQRIMLAVGQGEGDLQGNDDKVLQAAVDYVFRLGGGTVRVLPGAYTMRNALFLRPGIHLRGSGASSVLKKAPSVTSRVIRDADSCEYCLQVADPKGFTPGCGIEVINKKWQIRLYTVLAVRGNVLYLDQRTGMDFPVHDEPKVQTVFSILDAHNADDVEVEEIVLDGNRAENEWMNGNYGAGVYLMCSNRCTFRDVVVRDYNGDGFTLGTSDDVHLENCQVLDSARFGFHPGFFAQRPIFKNCTVKGGEQGIYWCQGVCDGLAENCTFSDNSKYGMSFGDRDTDNVVRNCSIERNGEAGVFFRNQGVESRTPDRNRIEGCLIRDNGGAGECGVEITWKTRDITIANCRFENSPQGKQRVAIRISPQAERITLQANSFTHCPVEVEDLRATQTK